jgi:hypothetical protein
MYIVILVAVVLGCVFMVYWAIGGLLWLSNGLFNMNRPDAVTVYPKRQWFDRLVWFYCHPLQILRRLAPRSLKRFCPPIEICGVD